MQIVYTTNNFQGAVCRAILSIVLGIILVIWPGAAIKYIIMLIGVLFLVTGFIAFVVSNRNREDHKRSLVPFSGIGSMVLGLLLLCLPSFFVTIFMFLLGFILVLGAVGQFVTLGSARRFGTVGLTDYIFPVIILIAGIVVIFDPFPSAEGVFIMFGIAAVFYGVTDLLNQRKIKLLRRKFEEREKMVKMENGQEVEDAEIVE